VKAIAWVLGHALRSAATDACFMDICALDMRLSAGRSWIKAAQDACCMQWNARAMAAAPWAILLHFHVIGGVHHAGPFPITSHHF
jgi:hypothetical protein